MRRLIIRMAMTAAVLSGVAAFACGDKLLAIGRGVRFQRLYAARTANLLIYSAGGSGGANLDGARLQTTLKRAVRNLQVVRDRSQLDGALKSGQADVVLVDFADLNDIARELRSAPSRPAILPVLVKPSKADLAAAEKEYKFVLRADADELQYLTVVDAAMKVRSKAGAKS